MFVDTPGIHKPLHRLNVRMVDAALDTLREVDVVAARGRRAAKPSGGGDRFLLDLVASVEDAARAGAEQGRSGRRRQTCCRV